jgi:(4-(4-[2-(gamma-L-glutamylamino)ethyl]phenoxymethyl)furan-2-yl)methanamine synthase
LGNIKSEEYTVETADGRGKTRFEAMARLARVVCADIDMLEEQELLQMAQYVYNCQLDQVTNALRQVLGRLKLAANNKVIAVVTGIGKESVARKAAQKAGFSKIVDLGDLFQNRETVKASPAFGVALLTAEKLERRSLKWMQL